MKFDETFILPFVQKHLGDQAVAEVRKTWQEGMKPIPEGASFEEKYGVAYANWIWLAKNIYPFIRKRMGEDGLKKFERAEIEGLIKKNRQRYCVGSGHGNSVLTEVWCFDIGLPWPENLGFIFQGLCITSSQEAIEGRASSWMKKTFSASWPILRIARRDFPSVFMPTHC
jgi:hypothetical protein